MRGEKRLTARQVATLGEGYHADGGGLYLQVTATGARSWIFRYQLAKRRREMGLGPVSAVTLAEARQGAHECHRLVARGIDPIEERRRGRIPTSRLWGVAAADYIAAQEAGWKNDEQAAQWRQSLKDHGPREDLPVADLDTAAVLACLRPLWKPRDQGGRPETAGRLRGRIERIWDAERVAGTVAGENPARWKGHLAALLPPLAKLKQARHFAAMPYSELPAFMASLAELDKPARRALRFTILTAARTEETVGATWREFDLEAGIWTIPAERMKAGREHVVPLTQAAIGILARLPRKQPPFGLSENAMLFLVQKAAPKGYGLPYTVHGFRSAFRDWAAETTHFPSDVVEMALAHAIRNKVEAAYRRGKLLEKRRQLMDAWAAYLAA